jgi:hypothetical protein
MQCPKCGFNGQDQGIECPRCGVIYSKIRLGPARTVDRVKQAELKESPPTALPDLSYESFAARLLLSVNPKADSTDLVLRAGFYVIFFLWGWAFIFSSVNTQAFGGGFWHLVNLPFHEAGHIVFRPFGRLVTSMGGTLGQLLMPLVCMGVFLVKTRDTFAASFCLWWLGQNFMDISPYIDDARRLTMPLVGGNTGQTSPYGFHDWEFILTETGLIRYDHTFARLSHALGTCLILLAFAWGGFLIYSYYIQLQREDA